jgi:hypothetical protein
LHCRGYVQALKDSHRFLVARKAAEIEATFGVVLDDPVDEFNAARHVGNDGSPSTRPPPTPERMEEFWGSRHECGSIHREELVRGAVRGSRGRP